MWQNIQSIGCHVFVLLLFYSSSALCDLTCLGRDISWQVSGCGGGRGEEKNSRQTTLTKFLLARNPLGVRGDFAIIAAYCCVSLSVVADALDKAASFGMLPRRRRDASSASKPEAPLLSAAFHRHYILSAAASAAAALVMCVLRVWHSPRSTAPPVLSEPTQ